MRGLLLSALLLGIGTPGCGEVGTIGNPPELWLNVDAGEDPEPPPGGDPAPGDAGAGGGDSSAADPVPPPADAAPADPPVHAPAVDFGYYRVDLVTGGGASYADVVNDWTNLAYVDWYADARAFDYPEGGDMTQVRANMDGILARVTGAGLEVMMDIAYGGAWGPRLTKAAILGTAAPYWDRVKYIILGDELTLSRAEANDRLDELRRAIANLGLAPRPIGVTLTPQLVLGGDAPPEILAASWDFISIEAYTPSCTCSACGRGAPADEAAAVVAQTRAQEARVPAGIDLVLVLQGYDRNGAFDRVDALAAVNRQSYFDLVKGNPRYRAMVAFNWQREGSTCAEHPYPAWGHGTSGIPELQAVHQEIWADLTTTP